MIPRATVHRYKKVKMLLPPTDRGGSWDDGSPLGTMVWACVWSGAETYQKGKHYLAPGDYFYGLDQEITPMRSRFAKKVKFEEMYTIENNTGESKG